MASRRDYLVGFDGLRLVGALSVMFSHAYYIARGSEDTEPLVRLLGDGNILGVYGVYTFFIISGFLLTRSLSARPDPIVYAVNRTLRLLPGFLGCVLVVAVVIGPLFSTVTLGEYWARPETWRYISKSVRVLEDGWLPAIYPHNGVTAEMVNGSLWSLRYEALSYVFLLVLWQVFGRSGWVAAVVAVLAVLTFSWSAANERLPGIAYTLPYFSGGVVLAWIRSRYRLDSRVAVLCGLGLVASAVAGVQMVAFAVFGAYIVVYLGERDNLASRLTQRIGDCSYGIYLYGWPAEQMVKHWTGTTRPLLLLALAVPLAFVLAYASSRLVELPAMRLRKPLAGALHRAVSGLLALAPRARVMAIRSAKVAFIVAASVVLTSETLWWYFLWSMSTIALVSAVAFVAPILALVLLEHVADRAT